MEKIITIKIVNKYGNDLNYPVCDDAKLLCELTGKKTFNNAELFTVKGLGYQIKVETPTLKITKIKLSGETITLPINLGGK